MYWLILIFSSTALFNQGSGLPAHDHRHMLIDSTPCHAENLKLNNNYICDARGKVICLEGWSDPSKLCRIPICKIWDSVSRSRLGCDHGLCIKPNICACQIGWEGDRCQKCIPLPGCKEGSCLSKSFECICHNSSLWTGLHCDKPVCTSGCIEHGHCNLPGQCVCNNGWMGYDCDKCIPMSGCLNGGCKSNEPFTCQCREGWLGPQCDCPQCKKGTFPPDLVNGTAINETLTKVTDKNVVTPISTTSTPKIVSKTTKKVDFGFVGKDWFVDQFDKILFDDILLETSKSNISNLQDFDTSKINNSPQSNGKAKSSNGIGALNPFFDKATEKPVVTSKPGSFVIKYPKNQFNVNKL